LLLFYYKNKLYSIIKCKKLQIFHNIYVMGFWDRVSLELEYLGMTNKALAEKVGITASNIGKGVRQGSSPSADTAVKIAKILGVSVEYLVTGERPAGESGDKITALTKRLRRLSDADLEIAKIVIHRLEK